MGRITLGNLQRALAQLVLWAKNTFAGIAGYAKDLIVGQADSITGKEEYAEYKYRRTADGAAVGNIALLQGIRGKSLVWNQKVAPFNRNEGTYNGATVSVNASVLEIIAPDGTTDEIIYTNYLSEDSLGFRQQAGHKYYSPNTLPSGIWFTNNVVSNGYTLCRGSISEGRDSSSRIQQWSLKSEVGTVIPQKVYCPIMVFDLTLMFGAGNEPETPEEFEALFPLPYYDYNPGEIISNKAEAIESVGFNQWDEEFEGGSIDANTGANSNSSGTGRSKNFISVFPNTNYFVQIPTRTTTYFRPFYYRKDGSFIGTESYKLGPIVLTMPSDCYYMRFIVSLGYYGSTTYNHDICVNLSDPSRNGEYEPYRKYTLPLNIPTLTGKLNGEGESVVVFPDGLKSAGSVYDEIVGNKAIKRVGVVDMGTLSGFYKVGTAGKFQFPKESNGLKTDVSPLLCIKYRYVPNMGYSGDDGTITDSSISNSVAIISDSNNASTSASDFRTSLSGVLLYYELTEPEEYILDEPLRFDYNVETGGTEQVLPSDTAEVVMPPFPCTVKYGIGIESLVTKSGLTAVAPKIFVGTCETAAATSAKVITTEEFPVDENNKPVVGTVIGVKFSATNSASNVTFNVNGTGAIGLYYNTSAATSTSAIYAGSANRYGFYVYDGTYWVWLSYGVDTNDNYLAYQVRYQSASKPLTDSLGRYRILFSSADDSKWVPANAVTTTDATTARAVCQTPINPFGQIVYYGTTSVKTADTIPASSVLHSQQGFGLGYSFNRTGADLELTVNAPVYVKCAPQADGSAIMDADTPIVQALPGTEDGKIYIYLGLTYSATNIELAIVHPVYHFKDGAIRIWTNAVKGEPVASAQPQGGFLPNVFYNLGELTGSVTFSLATPSDNTIVNHYYWTFETGSTAPTITWPNGITWVGGSAPEISASKHYEISVLNGIGTFMEV